MCVFNNIYIACSFIAVKTPPRHQPAWFFHFKMILRFPAVHGFQYIEFVDLEISDFNNRFSVSSWIRHAWRTCLLPAGRGWGRWTLPRIHAGFFSKRPPGFDHTIGILTLGADKSMHCMSIVGQCCIEENASLNYITSNYPVNPQYHQHSIPSILCLNYDHSSTVTPTIILSCQRMYL